MTDLQSLCSTTVAYMVREFDATHNMAYVYKVLETDAPYLAHELQGRVPNIQYNTCLAITLDVCTQLFNSSKRYL